jgi:hypothetical protein
LLAHRPELVLLHVRVKPQSLVTAVVLNSESKP